MAKIVVEFDTESKLAVATLDGKELPYLWAVSIYNSSYEDDDPNFLCSLTTKDASNKSGGYTTYTNIVAKNIEALAENEDVKLNHQIKTFLNKKLS